MPIRDRRRARRLQNRTHELEARRYDGARVRFLQARAAVKRYEMLLEQAQRQGQPSAQLAEYERLLAAHRHFLDSLEVPGEEA